MMSQLNNDTRCIWNEDHQRYSVFKYDYATSKWQFLEWKPAGWQAPSEQQLTPNIAHPQYRQDSVQVPTASAAWGATSAYEQRADTCGMPNQQHGSHSAPFTSQSHGQVPYPGAHVVTNYSQELKPFPKGAGAVVPGHYNAKLGTAPGNLHYEELDHSYYVRDRKFFQEGKIFAVIFTEASGSTATSYNSSISVVRIPGDLVHTQIRRFVVVRTKREFCFACPIFTYSGRATLKRGVRAEEHGIAYSEGVNPQPINGEKGIKKPSVAVSMAPGEPNLHIASRIYYGIHHPIQYNVKAKDIGQVLQQHLPFLIGNWKAEDESETMQAAEVTDMAEEPEVPQTQEEYGEENDGRIGKFDKALDKAKKHTSQSHIASDDSHLYHPRNNIYGFDTEVAPHIYHPIHNPFGYHPINNTHGYHPESNPFSYHPTHNPHGHHPQQAPFGYHPRLSPHGYHAVHNTKGYHPTSALYNYHPQVNPQGHHPVHNAHGYHPVYNVYGYHEQYNPQGYHQHHNPFAYHPRYNPRGPHGVANDDDDDEEEESEDSEDDEIVLR